MKVYAAQSYALHSAESQIQTAAEKHAILPCTFRRLGEFWSLQEAVVDTKVKFSPLSNWDIFVDCQVFITEVIL